jgi:hypothetical protein
MNIYMLFVGEQYNERAGGMENFHSAHSALGNAFKAAEEYIEDACADWANIVEIAPDGMMRWWSNGPRGLEEDHEFDPYDWTEMNFQPWQFEYAPARHAQEDADA